MKRSKFDVMGCIPGASPPLSGFPAKPELEVDSEVVPEWAAHVISLLEELHALKRLQGSYSTSSVLMEPPLQGYKTITEKKKLDMFELPQRHTT